ncbi:DUF1996 domain-containing protein [Actinoplanes sp. N902-109]|uniref:DUF1996 domain-containing protein n=1 Tax=Actinoplanes sp. (strain N902-109) TaxID=649831 RepID=UPI0003293600|nr:DUF1996 domain-containing protein [Actinoplanes sp. N902-109]AGL14072.1 hypothetical protein L083_0562 [Actinoplanes sp. N902-109]
MAEAWGRRRAVALTLAIELVLAGAVFGAARVTTPQLGPDFVDIAEVPVGATPAAVTAFSWDCGRDEIGHRNTANIVVTPRKAGPAHHVHEYVGNLSVDVGSTVEGLPGGGTTCPNGDESTYYWPVLRTVREGDGPHGGAIQVPASVTLTVYGNPRGPVLPMPRLLRGAVGDAYALTNGGALAAPVWSCQGAEQRRTLEYPICGAGQRVVRIFDFPSCWDGRQVDTEGHRRQLVPPVAGGGCPASTFAVPRLEIVVAYDIPQGTRFRIDTFDAQRHSPRTDHAFFVNLMPETLSRKIAACLNNTTPCPGPRGG